MSNLANQSLVQAMDLVATLSARWGDVQQPDGLMGFDLLMWEFYRSNKVLLLSGLERSEAGGTFASDEQEADWEAAYSAFVQSRFNK